MIHTHDKEVVCDHFSGDWFSLHGPRYEQVNGASIEGTAYEMGQIADALERGGSFGATRCRVRVDGDCFLLDSPRNSVNPTRIPMRFAAGLIASIREEVAKPREPEPDYSEPEAP